ncbi:MAG: PadR family transcriptional regulator [Thermoplasmata archaeon]|nr:PadR family transcriptional regulator [Thermoplasmata archaeon]
MFGFGGFRKKPGLRECVMFLLARTPKNGAELMDEMERISNGWWRPSPGSVYPLLEELTKEGAVQKRPDGRYEVTAQSREEYSWMRGWMNQPRNTQDILQELSGYVSYLEETAQRGPAAEWKAHQEQLRLLARRLQELAD